jgi:hypothetical protein
MGDSLFGFAKVGASGLVMFFGFVGRLITGCNMRLDGTPSTDAALLCRSVEFEAPSG